jgi:hypothetical protein
VVGNGFVHTLKPRRPHLQHLLIPLQPWSPLRSSQLLRAPVSLPQLFRPLKLAPWPLRRLSLLLW